MEGYAEGTFNSKLRILLIIRICEITNFVKILENEMTKFVIFPGRRTAVLRRKAYQLLLDWKKSQSRKRKALFVTGARQIGKSYLIQHLGRTE